MTKAKMTKAKALKAAAKHFGMPVRGIGYRGHSVFHREYVVQILAQDWKAGQPALASGKGKNAAEAWADCVLGFEG